MLAQVSGEEGHEASELDEMDPQVQYLRLVVLFL